jgi:hypothetical protein
MAKSQPRTAGEAKRAEEKKKKSKDQRKRAFQAMRTGDLNKLFAKRYDSTREDYVFPDDDAGVDDLRILLGHYAYSNPLRLTKIAALRAPWLKGAQLEYMIADAATSPRMWTFQELGDYMNLTEAERKDLGIRTIGTVDVTPRQRKQARKVRDKERKAKARRAKGAKPRDQYLAASKSREEPWKAAKISRRTWYRRLAKQNGTSPSTVNLIKAADAVVPRRGGHDGHAKASVRSSGVMLVAKDNPAANPNIPATATKPKKKGQRLEISDTRHDEPVSRTIREAA